METDIKVALIEKMPAVIGLMLALALLLWFADDLKRYLNHVAKVEVAGVTLEFDKSSAPKSFATELEHFTPNQALKERLGALAPKFRRASLLVMHDHADEAHWLAQAFRRLGMQVDVGLCATDARILMKQHHDVVLSDIDWSACPEGPQNAVQVLNEIQPEGRRVVFYILNLEGNVRRVPHYAHDITNTFEGMINGILDVISRSERLAS